MLPPKIRDCFLICHGITNRKNAGVVGKQVRPSFGSGGSKGSHDPPGLSDDAAPGGLWQVSASVLYKKPCKITAAESCLQTWAAVLCSVSAHVSSLQKKFTRQHFLWKHRSPANEILQLQSIYPSPSVLQRRSSSHTAHEAPIYIDCFHYFELWFLRKRPCRIYTCCRNPLACLSLQAALCLIQTPHIQCWFWLVHKAAGSESWPIGCVRISVNTLPTGQFQKFLRCLKFT